jgi:hypothetical protein
MAEKAGEHTNSTHGEAGIHEKPHRIDASTTVGMTAEQAQQFETDGFFVIPDCLSSPELQTLLAASEELAEQYRRDKDGDKSTPFQVRNVLARHPAFLELVDHPKILPIVVAAIGPDIQIRTSHLDYRPPYPPGSEDQVGGVGFGKSDAYTPQRNWHPDLAPQLSAVAVGGPAQDMVQFFELKVFYALFDMTASGCGNLWLAKGSHRRTRGELAACQADLVEPPGATELKVPAGAAVLWRTACWHCVGPNTSPATRKILHIGYHHRWLRPTDYTDQDPALLASCSPVRRQLLGAMPEGRDPLGSNPDWEPASKFWQPSFDDVPLRAEAERWQAAAAAKL